MSDELNSDAEINAAYEAFRRELRASFWRGFRHGILRWFPVAIAFMLGLVLGRKLP